MKLAVTATVADAQALCARGRHAVTVDDYLRGTHFPAAIEIDNLSGEYHYLSAGYYVSLLAEARGHRASPSLRDICDSWHERALAPAGERRCARSRIAVLHEAGAGDAPADMASLRYFRSLARREGVEVCIIGPRDLHRLGEFGALWIRSLTMPHGVGYVFARCAENLGLPVIDDSRSILRCCNKVFAAERLAQHGVPAPRSLIVGEHTSIAEIEAAFSYPVILKGPDGSFSRSVIRADDRAALNLHIGTLRAHSHLILAQEYMPTAFDWRIGVLDGRPLYACQYRMARGHWQIYKHRQGRRPLSGSVKVVPLEEVPRQVVGPAVEAAAAMGDGLYGVDLKQTDRGVFAIEVNDNPDINRGLEDGAEGERLWLDILAWFGRRSLGRLVPAAVPPPSRTTRPRSPAMSRVK
jgi:glutathione synthase/RimK-type ligase-like ATP-grasp enzyme